MPTLEEARNWYDARDPVHGFDHVQRVLLLAEHIGKRVGADLSILRAAALLHDASGAFPGQDGGRQEHEVLSSQFARTVLQGEGWPEERIEAVVHCIAAHRYRGEGEPLSLEAKVLFDADKLDVLGAFGIARTIGYAVQAGEPVYAPPSEGFLERGEKLPGEPHSAYHEYLFKLRHVAGRLHTREARRLARRRLAHEAAGAT
jgi:uncharacterized protein